MNMGYLVCLLGYTLVVGLVKAEPIGYPITVPVNFCQDEYTFQNMPSAVSGINFSPVISSRIAYFQRATLV